MNFEQTITLWRSALFSPKKTFASAKRNASYDTVLIWIIVVGLLEYLLAAVPDFIVTPWHYLFLSTPQDLLLRAIESIFSIALQLFVWSGAVYLTARFLGGSGKYKEFMYLFAAFFLPVFLIVSIVGSVLSIVYNLLLLGFIPVSMTHSSILDVGVFVRGITNVFSLIAEIYWLCLAVLSIRAASKLSLARSIASVAIPFALIFAVYALTRFPK